MYINIKVFLEESFDSFVGMDLLSLENSIFVQIRAKKTNTLEEIYEQLAESYVSKLYINFKQF